MEGRGEEGGGVIITLYSTVRGGGGRGGGGGVIITLYSTVRGGGEGGGGGMSHASTVRGGVGSGEGMWFTGDKCEHSNVVVEYAKGRLRRTRKKQ